MTLRTHTVEFGPRQLAAVRRINAVLALSPRLSGEAGDLDRNQRLNAVLNQLVPPLTGAALRRRRIRVETDVAPGPDGPVPLRILLPPSLPRALVVDFHGGGWVYGGAGLNDRLNAHLVATAGLAVVSIDYRLVSEREERFIDAVAGDCLAGARWALDHAAARFSVADLFLIGESAGAHLAALTATALRDEGRMNAVRGCVFSYGVFDLSATPSVRDAGPDTLALDGPAIVRALARLAPDRDEAGLRRPDISPLYADLTGLPPALFLSGDRDPLRDDSRLMARAWGRAADADLIQVPEAPHAFLQFGGPAARGARIAVRRWLDDRLKAVSVENPKA